MSATAATSHVSRGMNVKELTLMTQSTQRVKHES